MFVPRRLVACFAVSLAAVAGCRSSELASTGPAVTGSITRSTTVPLAASSTTSSPAPPIASTTAGQTSAVEPPTTARRPEPTEPATTAPGAPGPSMVGALDLHLDGDPLHTPSILGFGALTQVDDAALLDRVSAVLGAADADTGWIPMPEAYACTRASEYRSLLWDDVRFVLRRNADPAGAYLAAWSVGATALAFSPPLAAEIGNESGITTPDGIGLGASVARLDGVDFAEAWREGDRFFGLAAVGPTVFQLDANDHVVAMSFEQNDCLDPDAPR